ncbi:spermidine/putrescine transport system substrate-binding protein [Candidatus Kryptonium thompsonii]|uniref:ABC transporter substrate-binding protein n=1 Tax=Candidatus Kryptonium thompsonii TaxID=1633631 RepID=UPI0007084AAD|nr:spermidine/putrescine ABC transporter substrate-binding protein [Candidatus Kryptonium thompsoni]CUS83969.1 spermidine/putrescine transport system substrate-binding protein [Candidatus Kryptonium thompsoni]CUS92088.1 spermidine/putrescine transport system substrate-binding protein [Candidatus Kryptonium thompsoni]
MKVKLLTIVLSSIFILIFNSCSRSKNEVNVYVWSDYLSQDVIEEFEKETGIKVNLDTYDSNEALLEKLQTGVSKYDVVVPSDYMVQILIRQNLLHEIDKTKIPNLKHINSRFLNLQYDPENKFSVPFFWGTTGFAYRKDKVGELPETWSVLFDEKYKGKILMLDDMRECFAVALKLLGHSINETDTSILLKAKEILANQKKLVKQYNSSGFDQAILSGDVWIAHGWSGQLVKISESDSNIVYVLPKEGGTLWIDNLAIPKSAENIENAHIFINFLLKPEISARVSEFSGYATVNETAKKFINQKYLTKQRYPDEEALKNFELMQDLGTVTKLLDRFWTEIKSQ